ncbi:hypothetical protein SDC9_107617 [bioreactor metagenome]|uniref:Uncharacterized protein n=1 Tax=bioreactor metagenome TaxID=1076179 RepID=A0A645BC52_9ZZZZ
MAELFRRRAGIIRQGGVNVKQVVYIGTCRGGDASRRIALCAAQPIGGTRGCLIGAPERIAIRIGIRRGDGVERHSDGDCLERIFRRAGRGGECERRIQNITCVSDLCRLRDEPRRGPDRERRCRNIAHREGERRGLIADRRCGGGEEVLWRDAGDMLRKARKLRTGRVCPTVRGVEGTGKVPQIQRKRFRHAHLQGGLAGKADGGKASEVSAREPVVALPEGVLADIEREDFLLQVLYDLRTLIPLLRQNKT